MKKQTKVVKKRRRQGKTDYKKRLKMLKGNFIRLVVRKSNRYVLLQIVESKRAQDRVLVTISTKELLKHGWSSEKKGSLKSLGAAYLGGMLLGRKIKDKIKGKVILDSGLIPSTKGSRVYAAVKGIADAGVKVVYDDKIAPSDEMIKKFDFFDEVKAKIGGLK